MKGQGEPQVSKALPGLAAPMSRRAGLYRMQLLLSAATRPVLHALLDAALPAIHALPEARRTRSGRIALWIGAVALVAIALKVVFGL